MRRLLVFAVPALLAGCATRPAPVPIAAPLPPPVAAPAPAFAGYGALAVPPRLADGSFATPNRDLSAAAAIWHLRAGLNVAALSCRGPAEAALIAGYNRLLRDQAASFARAYQALGTEYGGVAAFDAGMTRLYNYYALPVAQPGLCAAADAALAELALLPPGALDQAAPAMLSRLDQPFQTVFAAQDAWLARRTLIAAAPQLTIDFSALR